MAHPEPIEIEAGAEEVRLGSFLFTLVEPHRGHQVAYNRWYERDHFYSGCLIGPYNFAGRRFVATADLKAMRDPDPSTITGSPENGSYLALYWILDGYGEVWGRWAGQQVMALHRAGRMFEHRDHVHTQLYDFAWQASGGDGVPAELVLDHPYRGLVAEFVDVAEGSSPAELDRSLARLLEAGIPAPTGVGSVIVARPQAMPARAPGVEAREGLEGRRLVLWFLSEHPERVWPAVMELRKEMESDSPGVVRAALPFIPTIPGTDTYTDQIWAD